MQRASSVGGLGSRNSRLIWKQRGGILCLCVRRDLGSKEEGGLLCWIVGLLWGRGDLSPEAVRVERGKGIVCVGRGKLVMSM